MRLRDGDGRLKEPTLSLLQCIYWYLTSPTDAKVGLRRQQKCHQHQNHEYLILYIYLIPNYLWGHEFIDFIYFIQFLTSLCHVMSSAPSPSQSSSPLPSLTSTTVSPLLSSAGKVLNISNENLRYRSMSSLAGSPPPSSPPGLSQGYGKGFGGLSQWVDEDRNRMVHLERLANRMV